MNDFLTLRAESKRDLENILLELLQNWGYREIAARSVAVSGQKGISGFWTGGGIRTDWTLSVARLGNTADVSRLCYLGPVFSLGDFKDARLSYQVGAELLSNPSPLADAEIVILAMKALTASGIDEWKMGLGYSGLIEMLLAGWDIGQNDRQIAQDILATSDLVSYRQFISCLDLENEKQQMFEDLLFSEIDDDFLALWEDKLKGTRSGNTLHDLLILSEALDGYGLVGKTYWDFGLVRDLNYYKGIVLEGYISGSGQAVVGGGRYSLPNGPEGSKTSGVGFGINIDELLAAMPSFSSSENVIDCILGGDGESNSRFWQEIMLRKQAGARIDYLLRPITKTKLIEIAKKRDISVAIWISKQGVKEISIEEVSK